MIVYIWIRNSFLTIMTLGMVACAPDPPPETIKAQLVYFDGDVLFTNKEPFELHDCMLALEMPSEMYIYRWPSPVAPNAEVGPVPADSFVNRSSERFNDRRYAPRAVLVTCTDRSGKEYGGSRNLL